MPQCWPMVLTTPRTSRSALDKARPVYQDLSQFKLPAGFRGRSAVIVQLWWFVEGSLFRLSPQFAFGWRRFLLRLFGAQVGKQVLLRPSVRVTYPWKLTIGDHSWIGDDVSLYSLGAITIGSNAVISQGTYVCAGTHDPSSISFDISGPPITVEDQAWVAAHCFLMPGVTIGKGAVVAARSTVINSLPGGYVYAGSPAVMVKPRTMRPADRRSTEAGQAGSNG
jgi:putative colanic acid biosynthesis acetyltransferase WcaF